jgi:hypothetical protein
MQAALTLYTNADYRLFSLAWFFYGIAFALICVAFRKSRRWTTLKPVTQSGVFEGVCSCFLMFAGLSCQLLVEDSIPRIVETITVDPEERVVEIYPNTFKGKDGARLVTQIGDRYVFRDVVLPEGKDHKDLKVVKLMPIQAE